MLSALLDEKVEFVIVGAFALAAHGNPRSTGDIDIYINPENYNAERVLKALAQFGAPLSAITVQDLQTPDTVFQIGVVPCRIDFLTSIEGVQGFVEALDTAKSVVVDGLTFFVLGRNMLIKNKKALGRPQDLADVAWLEANTQ